LTRVFPDLKKAVALFVILFAQGASSALAAADSFLDIKMSPQRDRQGETAGDLRTDATEIAQILKIESFITALRNQKQAGVDSAHLSRAMQNARMLCLWKIFIASQEVRKVVAQINYDLSRANQELDQLIARRNMTMNMVNTVNFLQGGVLGTIKQASGLPTYPVQGYARQEMAVTSFGTGSSLAALNLFVPSLIRKRLDSREQPTILQHVFNPEFRPADAKYSYLWKFMNAPLPGHESGLTRRQVLVKHWKAIDGVNVDDARLVRTLVYAPDEKEQLSENIRLVTQRIDLLHDMKTHFEEFDAALYELHKAMSFD
jgi:hypothetical protein